MRISSLLNAATALIIAIVLWVHPGANGQRLYSLGGASILQEIDIDTRNVTDLVTITPSLSDIAFHPDGTLYGVNEHTIYRVNISDGSTEEITTLPASYGWLVGLTIDYLGNLYMSSLASGSDHILRYNLIADELEDLGKVGYSHWDLEFYKGKLYLSGGTDEINKGLLIEADLDDLANSKIVMDYEAQAYGISSFNDPCTGHELIAAIRDTMTFLYPTLSDFDKIPITDPLYSTSSGTASRTSYLGSLPQFEVALTTEGPVPCDTGALISLRVELMSNRPGVEFSLDGVNFQDSTLFANLEMGTYAVTVRDSFGCRFESIPVTVTPFDPEVTVSSSPAHCNKDNGQISLDVISGDQVEFSIDGNTWSDISTFASLPAGDYSVIMRNPAGCEKTVAVTIEEIPQLTHTLATTPEHCLQGDATIVVTAQGGQAPYSYSLVALPDQPTPVFTDLHEGTYSIRTSDALGCKVQDLVDVGATYAPVITDIQIEDAHCSQDDGSISITATGSTDLSFLIDGNAVANNAIQGIGEGVYTLSVLDDWGCRTDTSIAVSTLDGPRITSVTTTNDNCFSPAGTVEITAESSNSPDLSYSLNGSAFTGQVLYENVPAGTHTVAVRDEFGCEAVELIAVDMDPVPQIESHQVEDATCGLDNGTIMVFPNLIDGMQFSLNSSDWSTATTFVDLAAGNYHIEMRDQNGCVDEVEVNVSYIEPVLIEDIAIVDATCKENDGSIEVIPTQAGVPLEFSLNAGAFTDESVFTGLSPDSYHVIMRDDNGCLDSLDVAIDKPEGVIIESIEVTGADCGKENGMIRIAARNAVEIAFEDEIRNYPDVLENLPPGNIMVSLSGDYYCKADTLVTIPEIGCDIFVPNVFTPNGDGNNEILAPQFDPAEVRVTAFDIYDRWGTLIFSCDEGCAWDGTDNGEPVPAGVYVYYISSEDVYGKRNLKSGDVTILR